MKHASTSRTLQKAIGYLSRPALDVYDFAMIIVPNSVRRMILFACTAIMASIVHLCKGTVSFIAASSKNVVEKHGVLSAEMVEHAETFVCLCLVMIFIGFLGRRFIYFLWENSFGLVLGVCWWVLQPVTGLIRLGLLFVLELLPRV